MTKPIKITRLSCIYAYTFDVMINIVTKISVQIGSDKPYETLLRGYINHATNVDYNKTLQFDILTHDLYMKRYITRQTKWKPLYQIKPNTQLYNIMLAMIRDINYGLFVIGSEGPWRNIVYAGSLDKDPHYNIVNIPNRPILNFLNVDETDEPRFLS